MEISRRDHHPPMLGSQEVERYPPLCIFHSDICLGGNRKAEKEMGHILKPFNVTGIKLKQKGIKSA